MTGLTEFLLARIAEDESAAMYALSRDDGGALDYGGQWFGAVKHAERWEPTRALAECKAKQEVVDAAWSDHLRIEGEWGMCYGQDALEAANDYPDAIVALAAVYADHPDYREEWRP